METPTLMMNHPDNSRKDSSENKCTSSGTDSLSHLLRSESASSVEMIMRAAFREEHAAGGGKALADVTDWSIYNAVGRLYSGVA